MKTRTMVRWSLLPRANSDCTVIKPRDNSLEPGWNSRPSSLLLNFVRSSVKCCTRVILQTVSMFTFLVLFPVHLETPV